MCPGSTLRIILMEQYFAVFLILSFTGGSQGTTTLPQQQNTANLKDLCEVWNTYFVFADISDHFSGSGWKNIALKRFATKYIHSQSKCPIFHSIQCSLCALCYFVVDTGVDICPNFGLTSCNLTFPTSTPLSGKCRTKQIMTKCSWIREKCDNILFFLSGHSTLPRLSHMS